MLDQLQEYEQLWGPVEPSASILNASAVVAATASAENGSRGSSGTENSASLPLSSVSSNRGSVVACDFYNAVMIA